MFTAIRRFSLLEIQIEISTSLAVIGLLKKHFSVLLSGV